MRLIRFLLLVLAVVGIGMIAGRDLGSGSGESIDPCVEPLAWRIGTVDPRFGLSVDEVRAAVAEAAARWEEAGGRPFFQADTTGMTIDLVYDQRQEALERRRPVADRLRTLQDRADTYGRRAESLREQLEADEAAYRRRPTAASQRRYQASVDRYNSAVDLYNQAAAAYNDALDQAPRMTEPREVRAGDLQSTSRTRNGRVVAVERTLTVNVVGSRRELALVLTDELGHALGLGHVAHPDAIMAEVYWQPDEDSRGAAGAGAPRLHPADRAALQERCGIQG